MEGKESQQDLLKNVGDRIKQTRVAAGLSQEGFAKAAGMSAGFVWRIEEGRQNLGLKSLARVAFALNVSMADLLSGIDADPSSLGPRPYKRRLD